MTSVRPEPILSICIPTYNQPEAVRDLLEALLLQSSEEIEIVIADDSSNEETRTIVAEFEKKLPIRYFHNIRGSLDRAVIFLTEKANGKFVWWLGNERLVSDAVFKVMHYIRTTDDISLLWLNSRNVSDMRDVAFRFSRNHLFVNRDEVLLTDVGLLGFISATIFRRRDALNCLESAKYYIGSAFVCMYIILRVLAGNGRTLLVAEPLLLCEPKPPGERRWYDQFEVFGLSLYRVVRAFRGNFSRTAMRFALRKNLRQVIRAVLVERGMGLETGFASRTPKILPMLKLYWSYWEAWMAIPFLLLPRRALMFLYALYRGMNTNKNA